VADQTSASVDIAAKPGAVMAVIADFERYPEWIDSMKSAEVAVFWNPIQGSLLKGLEKRVES
jgi:hypothetical protein